MSKKPKNFGFTAGGNLEIKEPAGTIQLKRFMPLEPSERAALEEYRLETMADLQGQYEAERTKLNEAWEKYRSTGAGMREVIAANQRVADLDARLSAVRSAVRNIVPIENPKTNEILLAERYEERKLVSAVKDPWDKEVMRLCFYDFKPEHDQGKYVIDEEEAAAAASADAEAAGGEPSELTYKQTLKDGRKARIFFDPAADVNGFLSPSWPVRFTMGDTEYSSGIQAYEAERARELGMMDLRASLLKTNSPRTIRLMTRKVTAHPADAKGLWLKIFTEIYQQTEALKERLLATGTDSLVYADIRSGPSGVGLDEKDSGVLDPTKWKGENAVGLAQETVRTQMREGNLAEAPANAAPKEAAITEEEQAKAKVAAIINARRNSRPV
jgi:predicted NAD-dependent protein-ADP-ribosyltransferase YbiA (DUF1768 family)